MRSFLFLLLVAFKCFQLQAQSSEIDSLQAVLSELTVNDTAYVDIANEIAFKLSLTDQKNSSYYINLAISTAKDLNYQRGLLRAITLKGNGFLMIGLPDQALSYYLEVLSYKASEYPLEYVRLHNNIGEVYRRKEVFDSSLKYFDKALSLALEKLSQYQPVIIYSNLGEVSLMQGKVNDAESYFKQCLTNAVNTNHLRGQGYGYHGLAECEYRKGVVQNAIRLMKKAIEVRSEANHQRGLIQSYLKLGDYFLTNQVNNPDSALYYWKLTEEKADENQANDLLDETYNRLYSLYLEDRDIEKAAYYLDMHKSLGDSLRNAEFISSVEKMKTAYQAELILAENELLRQEQEQHKAEDEARLIVITLAFTIVLGLGFATFQYRRRQKSRIEAERDAVLTKSLLEFSKYLNEQDLDLAQFIDTLLNKSYEVLRCDRATYWHLDEKSNSLYLAGICERKDSTKIPKTRFTRDQFPKFFDDFMGQRTVAVSQISKDKRLADIYEQYFKPFGIESILNAPILIDGQFVGFISYTMTYNQVRDWDMQEQRYVGSIADLIVAAIAKDKSNRLEIEKEELIKKLRIRNKSLKEFNSVISHNLREPLTQIIGFSDLLTDIPSDADFNEIVARISDASNRIDRVIKELSTVLNEEDPKPSDFRELSLERLIKEVLDLLKIEIKNVNITIEQDLKVKKLKSYRPFLSDAIYHLLSNSLKFAEPEKRLHIKIESYEDDYYKFIKISDNGRGINLNKFADKLFKMYQRYHMDVEGRGIGLFIVKNRVTSLNGLIHVESEEGVGSAFTMEFPKEINMLASKNSQDH
ncbi:tetratricopeptide repeat-containing sensor histidine kinase [Ekhidna sp.]|jgi:signal transduction histidine kinase|uniref:tetratricopeptide repeat-containing sensor histidine kinase n=1 Tax=Ekhidna sp. TaxID=2608089 RepID=UPI0032EDC46A